MISKSLKKSIKNANINCNDEEILEIIEGMSEEEINHANKIGIKHWKVLKKLVLKTIDKELDLNQDEVIGKYLIWGPLAITNVNMLSSGGIFYYRIIITKEKVIYYGFDQGFKKVESKTKNITDIINIKQSKVSSINPKDRISINFQDGSVIILLALEKDSRQDIGQLINTLGELNITLSQVNHFMNE